MSESASNAPLTVVLVHGAFADSSSWDGVIERLQAAGVQVTAAPNPLRGISHDSAYVASFIRQVPGPVVGWVRVVRRSQRAIAQATAVESVPSRPAALP